MKHLILLFSLFCSLAVYGQNVDLIVTTSGDSLHCKIIEVTSEQIQFRFSTGTIIPIKRSEVTSYQYNFTPAAPAETPDRNIRQNNATPVYQTPAAVSPRETEMKETTAKKKQPFYIAVSAGAGSFGKAFTVIEDGTAIHFGLDVAYFIIPQLAAGFKLNFMGSDVNYNEYSTSISYYDMVTFYGPAVYGRFPAKKFAFLGSLGLGGLNWSISDAVIGGKKYDDESYSSFGGFISVGVNYMFTKHVGIGTNFQSLLGSIDDERYPAGLGVNFALCFRF